jgi:lysophospholipase L1-like esterase
MPLACRSFVPCAEASPCYLTISKVKSSKPHRLLRVRILWGNVALWRMACGSFIDPVFFAGERIMRIFRLGGIFAVLLLVAPAVMHAQLVEEFKPPRANCCLASSAQSLADQLLDWNQLGRYYEDNVRLKSMPDDPARVVFLGDSITDMWKLAQYFPEKPYINRGIGGQTMPQILVRMYPDVINLHPSVLVILAGTNDIARNTGPQSAEMIEDNFRAITELAQAHKIKIVLCSLTPVSDYTARKQTLQRPPADILLLNAWLKKYAEQIHAVYADYYAALADATGFLKEGHSMDGLHPNDKGYALMAPIVQAAVEKAQK